MALGVLNNLSAIYAENNLNNTSNSLQTVLQQLSSGSKINSGADDAAGLSLVNGLEANSTALSQSETNATEGVGLLQVADGALSQVTNLLDRAITLATEASNGTLNTSQEAAANQEYTSILSEINNIGSTTTYNQQQVFTGNTVAIYTGDSSAAGSSIDDLNIRTLSESSVGDTSGQMAYSTGENNVFVDLSSGGKNAALTDTLNLAGSTTISLNYLTKGTAGSVTTASANIVVGTGTAYANTAQGLISAINNSGLGLSATFATATQAGSAALAAAKSSQVAGGSGNDTGIEISAQGIGANDPTAIGAGVVGALTLGLSTDTLGGTLSIVGSDGTNHNIALGQANATDTLANLAATINTDNYGVTAQVNGAGTTLTLLSADSAVAVSGTNITDIAGGVPTAISLTDTPTQSQSSTTLGTLSLPAAGSAFGDTLAGNITIGSNVIALGTAGITDTLANLETYINKGNFGATASLNAAGTAMTFNSTNTALTVTNNGTDTTDGAAALGYAADGATGATASKYYSIGVSGVITDTSTTGGTTNVGIIADSNGTGGTATISYSDAAGQSLSNTDLLSQSDSSAALTALSTAITDVASLDGYIGAQINTLNSIGQVLTTQQENVTSAQNAIQATDYASATAAMSKYEILSQTGIAALAQANTVQQEVTKLLQ